MESEEPDLADILLTPSPVTKQPFSGGFELTIEQEMARAR